jgi:hypothetical protein
LKRRQMMVAYREGARQCAPTDCLGIFLLMG